MKTTKLEKQEVEISQPEKRPEITLPVIPEKRELPAEKKKFVPFEKPLGFRKAILL